MEHVEVTITNRYAYITEASQPAYNQLRDFWSYYPNGYFHAPSHKIWLRAKAMDMSKGKAKLAGWDGRIRMFSRGRVPSGLFRATKKELETEHGITFDLSYDLPDVDGIKPGTVSEDEKYRYQDECIEKMVKAFRRGGGIVLSATGTGKTAIAGKFFKLLPYNCLFIVDQINLLEQNSKEIHEWLGEPVGIVGKGEYTIQRVTVATIQTLKLHLKDKKFLKWFNTVQVVIVDELHEMIAKNNFKVLNTIQPIANYGLTATLQLPKKEIRTRAYAFAGPVIYKFPITEGIKRGVLTQGRVIQLLFPVEECASLDEDDYIESVVYDDWKAEVFRKLAAYLIDKDRYIIALVERIKHLKLLSKALNDIGLDHRVAYGAIETKAREKSQAEFEKGDTRLLLATRVFKKGVNIKRVDVMMDLAERYSPNDAVQKFGRGVRLHPDKSELLYIDFGTYGNYRFQRAAKSRARALRKAGIPVKTVKVESVQQVLKIIKKVLWEQQKEHQEKLKPKQLELPLT